jgi:hypothetical protein
MSSPLSGFFALFFARMDYQVSIRCCWRCGSAPEGSRFHCDALQDYAGRILTKGLEMLWAPSASLGLNGMTFTGMEWDGYGPPALMCWDIFWYVCHYVLSSFNLASISAVMTLFLSTTTPTFVFNLSQWHPSLTCALLCAARRQ